MRAKLLTISIAMITYGLTAAPGWSITKRSYNEKCLDQFNKMSSDGYISMTQNQLYDLIGQPKSLSITDKHIVLSYAVGEFWFVSKRLVEAKFSKSNCMIRKQP